MEQYNSTILEPGEVFHCLSCIWAQNSKILEVTRFFQKEKIFIG